jgi:hypothetical protein
MEQEKKRSQPKNGLSEENIREQILTLVRLQRIDTESAVLRARLEIFPAKTAGLDAELMESEKAILDEETLLGEAKKKYRSHETDLKANQSRIEKSKEKLRSVKTNKEYQAMLKEIEEAEAQSSRIEDEMIRCLEQMEKGEGDLAGRKQEHGQERGRIEEEKKALAEEAAEKRAQLDALEEQWAKVSAGLLPELLKRYLKVRDQVRGIAVAQVRQGICCGCHMNIPPQMYNELHRMNSLKFCPHCQRIIYWAPEEE